MATPDVTADGLEVVGRLTVTADDTPFEVRFEGSRVVVQIPDLRAANRLRKTATGRDRTARLLALQEFLARAGLELSVLVHGRVVGRLSAASRTGWLAARLGVAPVQLGLLAILAAVFRRSRGATTLPPDSSLPGVKQP